MQDKSRAHRNKTTRHEPEFEGSSEVKEESARTLMSAGSPLSNCPSVNVLICLGCMERRRYTKRRSRQFQSDQEPNRRTWIPPATPISLRLTKNLVSSTWALFSTHSTTQPMLTGSGRGSGSNLIPCKKPCFLNIARTYLYLVIVDGRPALYTRCVQLFPGFERI